MKKQKQARRYKYQNPRMNTTEPYWHSILPTNRASKRLLKQQSGSMGIIPLLRTVTVFTYDPAAFFTPWDDFDVMIMRSINEGPGKSCLVAEYLGRPPYEKEHYERMVKELTSPFGTNFNNIDKP